ncbi:MAG: L-lactate permease [Anaeromyxobacter sp.]
MPWIAGSPPLHPALAALAAAAPLGFLFWALAVRRLRAHLAAPAAVGLALVAAVAGFGMPPGLALGAALHGAAQGLWPVAWVVVTAVYLHALSVRTGAFEVVRGALASLTSDRRLQALLIAFAFAAFLEGAAGFGAPVAIAAAMLVGLGFEPLPAALVCLVANTAPVAFGALGVPVLVAGQAAGVDPLAVSQLVGRTLPALALLTPFYVVVLLAGARRGLEVWPAALVVGGAFALAQALTANLLGPYLPDVVASLVSMGCLTLFLRAWRPARPWRFPAEPAAPAPAGPRAARGDVLRALSPFLLLSLFVAAWGLRPVHAALDALGTVTLRWPGLDGAIVQDGHAVPAVLKLDLLASAGTAILLTALVSLPVLGARPSVALRTFGETLRTLRFPVLTIAAMLALAGIMNRSGMAAALGQVFAQTGRAFPLLAPVLGWLGVLMTGSDTASNALFGKLQASTAQQLGLDPVLAVAANTSGGGCGKMVSPQSLAVATAAVGQVGREGELLRATLKHSLLLTALVSLLVWLQAGPLAFLVPSSSPPPATPPPPPAALVAEGRAWLAVALAVIAGVALVAARVGRRPAAAGEA